MKKRILILIKDRKSHVILVFSSLTILFYITSIAGLERDVINPDGINWHARTGNFVNGLLTKHYSDTYQVYHPGTTLMWISGPALYFTENYFSAQNEPSYSKKTYLTYDYVAKLSVVIVATVLFIASLVLIHKLLTIQAVLIFGVLATFEPFMVGERRLYHLDYLMTYLLFVSFLCFYTYFYKDIKIHYLLIGTLLLVFSVFTKTSTIIFLPFPIMMGFFSRFALWRKILSIPVFILFLALFAFLTFPAVWKTPEKSISRYTEKMLTGITDIGYLGKKELGFSGAQKSITLDSTFEQAPWDYYIKVLVYKTSHVTWVLSIAAFIAMITKAFVFIIKSVQNLLITLKSSLNKKTLITKAHLSDTAWLTVYSFLIIDVFFTAFTIATKKGDRYAIVMIPFIFVIISHVFANINKKLALLVAVVAIISYIPQYIQIHPYYYAYGNPILGGVDEKYKVIDDAPFGVVIAEVFDVIKTDYKTSKDIFTIAGPKSLKTISDGAKFTKSPNCTTNYYVAFSLDDQPTTLCNSYKYSVIGVVKVGNMNYWNIYKKLNSGNQAIVETLNQDE